MQIEYFLRKNSPEPVLDCVAHPPRMEQGSFKEKAVRPVKAFLRLCLADQAKQSKTKQARLLCLAAAGLIVIQSNRAQPVATCKVRTNMNCGWFFSG